MDRAIEICVTIGIVFIFIGMMGTFLGFMINSFMMAICLIIAAVGGALIAVGMFIDLLWES